MRSQISNKGKVIFLTAEDILRYLLGTDDAIDTLVKCKRKDEIIIVTDKELYEALGSLKSYDSFSLPNLVKFFENVTVREDTRKRILTHERVDELRKSALSRR
jgi:hypothetical protein